MSFQEIEQVPPVKEFSPTAQGSRGEYYLIRSETKAIQDPPAAILMLYAPGLSKVIL